MDSQENKQSLLSRASLNCFTLSETIQKGDQFKNSLKIALIKNEKYPKYQDGIKTTII